MTKTVKIPVEYIEGLIEYFTLTIENLKSTIDDDQRFEVIPCIEGNLLSISNELMRFVKDNKKELREWDANELIEFTKLKLGMKNNE